MSRPLRYAPAGMVFHLLEPGPREYQLDLPGFPPKAERLTLTNQREIVVDSHLPKLPSPLRGIVVDRAGTPVSQAFVVYMGESGRQIPAAAGKERPLHTPRPHPARPDGEKD